MGTRPTERAFYRAFVRFTDFTTPNRKDGVVIVPAFGFSYCAQDGDAKLWIDDVRLELVYEIKPLQGCEPWRKSLRVEASCTPRGSG